MASEKGFINPNTAILCDEPAKPYIRSEGGITDVVSDHITDIIADQAHEIFDTDEVKEAIDGTAVLIQTITTEEDVLSYEIENIDYRKILLKCTSKQPITSPNANAIVKYNNVAKFITPIFSNTINATRILAEINFGDMRIPIVSSVTTGSGSLYMRNSVVLDGSIRSVNTIEINLPESQPDNTIEIWGVK